MAAKPELLWIGALAAFILVLVLMPITVRVWRALGRRDEEVSLRKIHAGEIPRVGGLVMILGFGVVAVVGFSGHTDLSRTHRLLSVSPMTGLLLGASIAGLAGLYDDVIGLRARYKLVFQVVAAIVAISFGLRWPAVDALLGENLVSTGGGVLLTGFGMVLITAVTHGTQEIAVGWTAATAVGCLCAFLLMNRHPARVFMGDSGAYFLGFLLAGILLFLYPVRPRKYVTDAFIPLIVMALPLLDMCLAIARRAVRGQPLFAGDADHIHHRLLAKGLSQWRAVLFLWIIALFFAGLGYLTVLGVSGQWTFFGGVVVVGVLCASLGYHKILSERGLWGTDEDGTSNSSWRNRRSQMVLLIDEVKKLAEDDPKDRGELRWRRMASDIGPILETMGMPSFEIRRDNEVIATGGAGVVGGAWLSLALPGYPEVELRMSLGNNIAGMLHSDQQILLERVLTALAGIEGSQRGGEAEPKSGASSDAIDHGAPPPLAQLTMQSEPPDGRHEDFEAPQRPH
jgi:UDP-GlcNAc:undecaprenyl-phosphate GlcNAc-1-phosphate transferase